LVRTVPTFRNPKIKKHNNCGREKQRLKTKHVFRWVLTKLILNKIDFVKMILVKISFEMIWFIFECFYYKIKVKSKI